MRPYSFCNLTEWNASDVESQEDVNNRAKAAAFIGTLQAAYTDFHYLRPIWKKTTEEDALLVFSTMSDVGCGRQLATIAGLITDGHVTLPPMQTLPLEQAAEAHVLIQTRHVRGKIVLNVAEF